FPGAPPSLPDALPISRVASGSMPAFPSRSLRSIKPPVPVNSMLIPCPPCAAIGRQDSSGASKSSTGIRSSQRRPPEGSLPRPFTRSAHRFRRLIVAGAATAGESGRQGLTQVVQTFALAGDLQHRVALEGSGHQVATEGHLGV